MTSSPACRKSDKPKEPIGPADNSQPPKPNAPPSTTTADTTETGKPVSADPNDKHGPKGVGTNHAIGEGTLSYLVEYENTAGAGATVPAQEVVVTDVLDTNLDLDTVEFTSFGFGSHRFTVPPGLSTYSTTIDLRPTGTNLLVSVDLDIDQLTRVLTARFGSLDPLTLLPPDDVDAGFLPVNDATHRGEGFFTYLVRPVAGIASGTTINNQASIVFDTNAPILTPVVTNTIDVGLPTSSVLPLTAKQNNSFTVKWTGTDDAAGIGTYDVFVSDNGGPFSPWKTAISANSALYTGALVGHTYAFYVVATDNVGLVEAAPTLPDTQTVISDNPWQNAENRFDVDHDMSAVAGDALILINNINAFGSRQLPAQRLANEHFLDPSGDEYLAPEDVLAIINHVNALDPPVLKESCQLARAISELRPRMIKHRAAPSPRLMN